MILYVYLKATANPVLIKCSHLPPRMHEIKTIIALPHRCLHLGPLICPVAEYEDSQASDPVQLLVYGNEFYHINVTKNGLYQVS